MRKSTSEEADSEQPKRNMDRNRLDGSREDETSASASGARKRSRGNDHRGDRQTSEYFSIQNRAELPSGSPFPGPVAPMALFQDGLRFPMQGRSNPLDLLAGSLQAHAQPQGSLQMATTPLHSAIQGQNPFLLQGHASNLVANHSVAAPSFVLHPLHFQLQIVPPIQQHHVHSGYPPFLQSVQPTIQQLSFPVQPTATVHSQAIQRSVQQAQQTLPVASAVPRATQAHSPEQLRPLSSDLRDDQSVNLPPLGEIAGKYYSERPIFTLYTDEDPNWLSSLHCFIRTDILEVFRSERSDNVHYPLTNKVTWKVGLRCRFCAHASREQRSPRSVAYPSTLEQVYQSFAMMLRDHFTVCKFIPDDINQTFSTLRQKQTQGATDSKRYWVHSAVVRGLLNSSGSNGIVCSPSSIEAGTRIPPFASPPDQVWIDQRLGALPVLETSEDHKAASPALVYLLEQCRIIIILPVERTSSRRTLQPDLAGLGCRKCYNRRRLGLCRVFPPRRKSMLQKMRLLYDHIIRCSLVDEETKTRLRDIGGKLVHERLNETAEERQILDLVWKKLKETEPSYIIRTIP